MVYNHFHHFPYLNGYFRGIDNIFKTYPGSKIPQQESLTVACALLARWAREVQFCQGISQIFLVFWNLGHHLSSFCLHCNSHVVGCFSWCCEMCS